MRPDRAALLSYLLGVATGLGLADIAGRLAG